MREYITFTFARTQIVLFSQASISIDYSQPLNFIAQEVNYFLVSNVISFFLFLSKDLVVFIASPVFFCLLFPR